MLASLTYNDENLKTQPKHFWKYISKFKKRMLKLLSNSKTEKIITEPLFIAEAFADHFSSSCPPKAPNYFDQTRSDF
jgi:hypothetical protein